MQVPVWQMDRSRERMGYDVSGTFFSEQGIEKGSYVKFYSPSNYLWVRGNNSINIKNSEKLRVTGGHFCVVGRVNAR